MEKPTTSAIRQIVAELRQPPLAISVATNSAVNSLDKLDAALIAFESQELAKAVSLLPTTTSLSDSSSHSEESSSSSDSESVTSAASKVSLAPPPTAEGKEVSSSPTLPTNDGQMIDLSLGVIDPESPTSPMLPSLPLSGLDQAPPTWPMCLMCLRRVWVDCRQHRRLQQNRMSGGLRRWGRPSP